MMTLGAASIAGGIVDVRVLVWNAKNVPNADWWTPMDPFVKITMGDRLRRTIALADAGGNVEWREEFLFDRANASNPIKFELWDEDLWWHDLVGSATLDLEEMMRDFSGKTLTENFELGLLSEEGDPAGVLMLDVTVGQPRDRRQQYDDESESESESEVEIGGGGHHGWDYKMQGEDWPIEGICPKSGVRQSPIALAIDGSQMSLASGPTFAYLSEEQSGIKALEYSMEFDEHGLKIRPITPDLLEEHVIFNGYKYLVNHFHFHSPSEHIYIEEGETYRYPLEVHVVHSFDEDSIIDDEEHHQRPFDLTLVLSVSFKEGRGRDRSLADAIAASSAFAPSTGETSVFKSSTPLLQLLIQSPGNDDLLHYRGSLTTPPCTEDVLWFIAKHQKLASSTALASFRDLLHFPETNGNYRVIQNEPDGSSGNQNSEAIFLTSFLRRPEVSSPIYKNERAENSHGDSQAELTTAWDYKRQGEDWLRGPCSEFSDRQSPIALATSHAVDLPSFESPKFHYARNSRGGGGSFAYFMTSDDHGLRVSLRNETFSHGFVEFQGKRFIVDHVHFHAPSEHLLLDSGNIHKFRLPLEAHFVHYLENSNSSADEILVVGILYDEDLMETMPNSIPDFVVDNFGFPLVPGEEMKVISPVALLENIIPYGTSIFHYRGSLTTPPCSENVLWFVLSQASQTSHTALEAFARLFKFHGTRGNFRQFQNFADGAPGNLNTQQIFKARAGVN